MGNPYLVLYNTALCGAWAYVLYLTVQTYFLDNGSTQDVYKAVELPLKAAQTAAVLEVVHSAVGLVRSPVFITALQVASRLWVLWGVIVPVQGPTTSGAIVLGHVGGVTLQLNLASLLVAWCLSEVVRYSFFALKELLGNVPYPSLWLRYSSFIPLYPLGVASELTMVYLAMPTIRDSGMWSIRMPNAYNWGFDYYWACILAVLTYLPGLPQLYLYMLTQRRKQLGGGSKGKAKQA